MFDFAFFKNDILVHQYNNLTYQDDIFVTEDICYNHKEKKLIRETDEHTFIIDFNNNDLLLKINNDNYEGSIPLLKSIVKENNKDIEITYQIDLEEPIYKITITRR